MGLYGDILNEALNGATRERTNLQEKVNHENDEINAVLRKAIKTPSKLSKKEKQMLSDNGYDMKNNRITQTKTGKQVDIGNKKNKYSYVTGKNDKYDYHDSFTKNNGNTMSDIVKKGYHGGYNKIVPDNGSNKYNKYNGKDYKKGTSEWSHNASRYIPYEDEDFATMKSLAKNQKVAQLNKDYFSSRPEQFENRIRSKGPVTARAQKEIDYWNEVGKDEVKRADKNISDISNAKKEILDRHRNRKKANEEYDYEITNKGYDDLDKAMLAKFQKPYKVSDEVRRQHEQAKKEQNIKR